MPAAREAVQADEERIEGAVARLVFENPDTGFVVGRLEVAGEAELTTFVGAMLAISPGDTVRLWGHWETDPRFGPQFRVHRYDTVLPHTAQGIERYLGSGLVPGIGPKMAQRLVEAFGTETLRVIDEEPQRLRRVSGIGRKRAKDIRAAWQKQRSLQAVMVFLQGVGIGTAQAARIYKQYGDKAVAVIRQNPYRLATEVAGIAFKSADVIARQVGIPEDSPLRAQAGLRYALERAGAEGHVFLPAEELVERAAELLGQRVETVEPTLAAAIQSGVVERDAHGVYTPILHRAEMQAARRISDLLRGPLPQVPIQIDKALAWIERTREIQLSPEQREAVRLALEAKALVITGGPGTGKTTVLTGILDVWERKGLKAVLAAPTGRAAKRMEAATGRGAQTLHRLLEFSPQQGGFTRNEANPIDADVVVLDECSMIDTLLLAASMDALRPDCRLVLVGDVDQLPSVGPGAVLMDLIASQALPVVHLRTVFRQAGQSGIVHNAHRVNQGQEPEFNDADFFFVERLDPAAARDTIVELAARRIPAKFGLDPRRDVQVLAPIRRGPAGVEGLNEALQTALNPSVERLAGRPFGIGDKVMQQRNNYELDVFNGDVGIVASFDDPSNTATIQFDGRAVAYPHDALDELDLAYAGTIHKSQGSEYPAVIMALLPQHYMLLQRNVLYTGLTRAKQLVVIVGDPRSIQRAARTTESARRHTALGDRLRKHTCKHTGTHAETNAKTQAEPHT